MLLCDCSFFKGFHFEVGAGSAVQYKGNTYFRKRNDPGVLVSTDMRVLVPISRLSLRTSDPSTDTAQQLLWQHEIERTSPLTAMSPGNQPENEMRTIPEDKGKAFPVSTENVRGPFNISDQNTDQTTNARNVGLVPTSADLVVSRQNSGQFQRAHLKRRSEPTPTEMMADSSERPKARRKYRSHSGELWRPPTSPDVESELDAPVFCLPDHVRPAAAVAAAAHGFEVTPPSHTYPGSSDTSEGRRPLELGQRVVAFDAKERMLRGCVRYIASSNERDKRGNLLIGIELVNSSSPWLEPCS